MEEKHEHCLRGHYKRYLWNDETELVPPRTKRRWQEHHDARAQTTPNVRDDDEEEVSLVMVRQK